MSSVPRYLPSYTVADYEQWEGDWELWQGIPVATTPSPFGDHQWCSLRLARALLDAVESAKCEAKVLQEIDWVISDDTVVRPDVVSICGGVPPRHVMRPPALIAEILSPSTADRDRSEKLRLYEENGVDYYMIVDPMAKTVMAYERNQGSFRTMKSESVRVEVCGNCLLELDLTTII